MNRIALSLAIAALFGLVGVSYADAETPILTKNDHAKSVMELDPASVFPTQGPDDGGE